MMRRTPIVSDDQMPPMRLTTIQSKLRQEREKGERTSATIRKLLNYCDDVQAHDLHPSYCLPGFIDISALW